MIGGILRIPIIIVRVGIWASAGAVSVLVSGWVSVTAATGAAGVGRVILGGIMTVTGTAIGMATGTVVGMSIAMITAIILTITILIRRVIMAVIMAVGWGEVR